MLTATKTKSGNSINIFRTENRNQRLIAYADLTNNPSNPNIFFIDGWTDGSSLNELEEIVRLVRENIK